jgi:hypothetical protein
MPHYDAEMIRDFLIQLEFELCLAGLDAETLHSEEGRELAESVRAFHERYGVSLLWTWAVDMQGVTEEEMGSVERKLAELDLAESQFQLNNLMQVQELLRNALQAAVERAADPDAEAVVRVKWPILASAVLAGPPREGAQ